MVQRDVQCNGKIVMVPVKFVNTETRADITQKQDYTNVLTGLSRPLDFNNKNTMNLVD